MQYRIATSADCQALTRLRMDMRRERDAGFCEETLSHNTLAFFERAIKAGSHIAFIGEQEGVIVATAGLSLFEMPPIAKLPNGKVAKLMNMYVVPQHRNKGIAKQMLDVVLSYAAAQGYHKVMLNASPMGKGLYENSGFTLIKNEYERFI